MNPLKYLGTALLLTVLAACSSHPNTPVSAAEGADGTLVIREKQVLRFATGGTGRGTLTLRGWQYSFEASNMTLAGVGPGDIQLEGDVYNVDDVSDFEGTYKLQAAEVGAGEGAEGFWFENEKGVRVHIRTHGQDVTVRVNATGAVVKLL